MENIVERVEYGDNIIKIFQEPHPIDPRSWDNLSVMLCFHGRYNLGDSNPYDHRDFEDWDGYRERIMEDFDVKVIRPLYLYDHGVLRIKIGSFQGLLPQGHARFDSGQIGFVFISQESIDNLGTEYEDSDELVRIMKSEVDTYDKFLSGQVYGYEVSSPEDDHVDSCTGFYDIQIALDKAKGLVDYDTLHNKT